MVAQPTLVDDGTTQNEIVMSSEVVGEEPQNEVEDTFEDVIMPNWEDKKRDEHSAGTIRQRHLPSKVRLLSCSHLQPMETFILFHF